MKVLYEKIIAKRIEKEIKAGSIILTNPSPNELFCYEVCYVGKGVLTNDGLIPLSVQEGDIIHTFPNAGFSFKFKDEEFRCLTENDVIFLESK